MASRLTSWICAGLVAAATMVGSATVASAQGEGRFDRRAGAMNQCAFGNCAMPMRRDFRSREIIGDRGALRERRVNRDRPRRVGPPRYRENEYRREYRRYPRYWGPRYRPYYDDDYYGGVGIYVAPRYIPRRTYRYSSAHVDWCYDRYRSYRAYDNTYQPYNGPRRQCYSPYS